MTGLSVASVHVYPVKGLRGLSPTQARLWPWGLEADRQWMITDLQGRFITQRTCRDMALINAVPTPEGLELGKANMPPCSVRFPDANAPMRSVTVWKDTVQARDAGEGAAVWLTELGATMQVGVDGYTSASAPAPLEYGRGSGFLCRWIPAAGGHYGIFGRFERAFA